MIKVGRLMYSLALTVIISSCSSGAQKTSEMKSGCTEEACFASIINVMANPSAYNGKRVTVTGYLASFGILGLYPTEINYRMGDAPSSIGFRIPMSQQKKWVDSGFLYKYVTINGVVDTTSHGFDGHRFADFVAVYAIGPVRMIEEKDDDHDFGVGVDFLNK